MQTASSIHADHVDRSYDRMDKEKTSHHRNLMLLSWEKHTVVEM
jgi:hypothetical protein